MSQAIGPTEDPYTNEWYRKQFQMLFHNFHRVMTEEADLQQQVRFLRKETKELSEQRAQDMAKIGQLQDRLDEATKRIDEAAKVVAELKKKVKT